MKDCLKKILMERYGIEVWFSYLDFECTMIYLDAVKENLRIVLNLLDACNIAVYNYDILEDLKDMDKLVWHISVEVLDNK